MTLPRRERATGPGHRVDKSLITVTGKEIIVRPPKHPADEITQILGGRYNKVNRSYKLQPTSWNVRTLVDWYGEEILTGAPWEVKNLALHDWGFTGWKGEKRHRAESHPRWDDLYDFQKEAVEYMVCNPHRGCLLGLDPGLGKAPTTIVAMDVLQVSKVLIVAPLTLARNWMAELDDWSQLYRSWSRATRSEKDPKTECVITNHEVLFVPHWIDEYGDDVEIEDGYARIGIGGKGNEEWIRASPVNMKEWIQSGPLKTDKRTGKEVPARQRIVKVRDTYDLDWEVIVIDESVVLKNRRAVKIDLLLALAKYAGMVWLLSGSPTAKYRNDLYPQMKMIMPRGFKSYWRFTEFFCTVDKGQWGWKVTGDRPEHDPKSYLRDFLFMRSQKDVLPELPDYIYDPVEVDLTVKQQKAFNEMMKDWITMLDNDKIVEATITLSQMTRAAQITSNLVNIGGTDSSSKSDILMTLLENDDIQFPLLIWTWWVPTAEAIHERLVKFVKGKGLTLDLVVGDMDAAIKDMCLQDYKSGETDILVLQMGVGKYGHTLTDTRTVFYHDRHFDSDAYFQSLRRVRRIGLEHSPRLIVPRSLRSFDPVVEANLSGKLQSIAKLGNKDLREMLMSLGGGMMPWSMEHEQ